jgi:hypothetical protein
LLGHLDHLQCQLLEPGEVDGHTCDQVYVTGAGNEYVLVAIDQSSGLPYMVQMPGKAPMTQAPVTEQVIMEDYQPLAGFQIATRLTIKHDGELFATGTVEEFVANPAVEEALFQR